MSTVYTDALNNKFLGNCKWGNHDINYPSTNWLKPSTIFSELSSDFNALLDAGALRKGSVITQTNANNWTTNNASFVQFSPQGDSITTRFQFSRTYLISSGAGSGGAEYQTAIRNDSNTSVAGIQRGGATGFNAIIPDGGTGLAGHIAVAGANSMAALIGRFTATATTANYVFWYACKVLNVNTNFSYYSASNLNSSVGLFIYNSSGTLTTAVEGAHFIANANKNLLQTGDAIYPIACQGGSPTPTGQWATDLYFFDNNATLGYPAIGKAENLLLGVGTYTYLKPVTLTTAPDAGSNLWLPIGTFAGRTLLMRCYAQ
jgi:hypothetical protein